MDGFEEVLVEWRVVRVVRFLRERVPSGPNYLLFSDPDRLADSLWDRSEVGWSPVPYEPVLGALQRALDRDLWGLVLEVRALLGTCTDMYLLTEAPAHAA